MQSDTADPRADATFPDAADVATQTIVLKKRNEKKARKMMRKLMLKFKVF